MTGKIIGACLIVAGCGGFGFTLTVSYKREEAALRQLVAALDYMQCELQYRLTALPDLCREVGNMGRSPVNCFFSNLAEELDCRIAPDMDSCFRLAMQKTGYIPGKAVEALQMLGTSLGRFDVEGQIQELEAVRTFSRAELQKMAHNRDNRLRSYQTLGLCAGAALAILFV